MALRLLLGDAHEGCSGAGRYGYAHGVDDDHCGW